MQHAPYNKHTSNELSVNMKLGHRHALQLQRLECKLQTFFCLRTKKFAAHRARSISLMAFDDASWHDIHSKALCLSFSPLPHGRLSFSVLAAWGILVVPCPASSFSSFRKPQLNQLMGGHFHFLSECALHILQVFQVVARQAAGWIGAR